MAGDASRLKKLRPLSRQRFSSRTAAQRELLSRGQPVAAPDLWWAEKDHLQAPAVVGDIVDPWSAEMPPGAGLPSVSLDAHVRGANYTGLETTRPVPSELDNEENAIEGQRQTQDVSSVRGENGEPLLVGDRNSSEVFREGEEWDALEEAEEDLIQAEFDLEAPQRHKSVDDVAEESVDVQPVENPQLHSGDDEISDDDGAAPLNWEPITDDLDDFDHDGYDSFRLEESDSCDGEFDALDLDEEARQAPWEPEVEAWSVRRAREKAAAVTELLDLSNTHERDEALGYLTVLFEHLRHPATFRAIQNAAAEVPLDLATLQAMVELRRVWLERRDWWLGRYGWGFKVCRLRHGPSAFTWALARRVCTARWEHDPHTMIDDEWLDEWLCLPRGADGFPSFPSYIAVKIQNIDAEALLVGLKAEARSNGYKEFGDDPTWYWRGRYPDDPIRNGFNLVPPRGEHPGRVSGDWRKTDDEYVE